jgi:hypothetical protein
MLPNLLRDRIQAEAYRKLLEFMTKPGGVGFNDFGFYSQKIMGITGARLQDATYDVADVLVRLHASRSTRLPDVQFVYWGDFHAPRMRKADGHEALLVGQTWRQGAKPNDELYEHLADTEHRLFGNKGTTVVFRRHTLLWDVLQSLPETEELLFSMEYAVAYIWGDDVHEETEADHKRRLERTLNLHAPYDRERLGFAPLPKRWHPSGSK